MNIAVDAMGGDNAPFEIVKGIYEASIENPNIKITLIGDEDKINQSFVQMQIKKPNNVYIVHTDIFVTMEDDPMTVMKEKSNSSITIGLRMLCNDEIDAFISAGNTGALHVASSLIVRRISGIRRSAIATVIPFNPPILMLDSGANPNVTPELLVQWAQLGSLYSRKILGVENPRVGLLNNGTEEHKGNEISVQAYQLLKECKNINFIGNIEGKSLPFSSCDVLVTDGFTGNITLKLVEGMAKFIFGNIKEMFSANLGTMLASLVMKKKLKAFKNDFDASEYGGAPLLGLRKPVIKAHGSSKAKDIKNAIRKACEYVESGIIEEIANQHKKEELK